MPIQRCSVSGKRGWKWGQSGKCYIGAGARRRAVRQARAIRASGYTGNVKHLGRTRIVPSNPLLADPSRTATLRKKFMREFTRRFARLKSRVIDLIVREDALGIKRVNRNPMGGDFDETLLERAKRESDFELQHIANLSGDNHKFNNNIGKKENLFRASPNLKNRRL